MALRGTASNTFTASSSFVFNVSAAGIQTGDLVLLMVFCETGTTTPPVSSSGFTVLDSQTINSTIGSETILWKVAGAADTSYTITPAGSTNGSCQCRAYSGRKNQTPTEVQTADGFQNFGSSFTLTGITAAAGDDVVAFWGVQSNSTQTFAASTPTGFANPILTQNTGVTQMPFVFGADFVNNGGGATGSISSTLTATVDTGQRWGGFVVTLPASGNSATTAWWKA